MRVSDMHRFTSALAMGGLLAGAMPAAAAFTYPGCADLAATDFTQEILASNATNPSIQEPMKLAFDMDASGNVTVYFTQRQGLLRKYDPIKKAVVDLADFSKYANWPTKFGGSSDGLIGIALDPAFKTNRWVYLYLTVGTAGAGEWRVSRFALNGETLDMASEKLMIKIPMSAGSVHPGGAMAFDKHGDLWITTGDNGKVTQSANTNDLRGKILRIRPKPDGTYENPAGNLFPASDKAKGEIYIMGNRNPYTITLDPERGGVTWGDVGPDGKGITEEHNFATKPGFYGWPYWAGDNVPINPSGTVEKPVNNATDNTGLKDLPPAIPGINNYAQACAITGPVYYYNNFPNSPAKMPPHLNGMWFISDFSRDKVEALVLDKAGAKIESRQPIFADMKFDRTLDFQVGPDGAFYFVNYAGYRDWTSKTGILKVSYKGTCRPAVGLANPRVAGGAIREVQVEGSLVAVMAEGAHTLEVKDVSGRLVSRRQGTGMARYDLAGIRGVGVCVVTVATAAGRSSFKMVR